MRGRKTNIYLLCMCILGILIICLFTNLILASVYMEKQYKSMSDFTDWFIEEYPDDEQKIIKFMKEYDTGKENAEKHYLAAYGFHKGSFGKHYKNIAVISSVLCVLFLVILSALFQYFMQLKKRHRIQEMTNHLIRANLDKHISVLSNMEDDFSGLEDEIYKTVTEMKSVKEIAVKERENFAESLANIAHQIKTPVTSLSVTVQLMQDKLDESDGIKLARQISRIDQLIDTLLTVSKIDAGILELKKSNVDVYTLLVLSVESLESQMEKKKIKVVLPNHPDVSFIGDLDWSVEVFSNLIKNSVEHMTDGGTLCFAYEKNPLYVEISIQDDGKGFDEKELPYIFDRFYQGRQKLKPGTGIGLSMAKSMIEMQAGFITAKNLKSGGACFIVRFYCH